MPATYGGVEHHVEQIGQRLAQRGHRVIVYSRRSYGELPAVPYLGMDIRLAPTIASKHLDAIVHSASATVLALLRRCDVIHYHALGPGLIAPLPRYASRSGVVLTVHGLDHERGKWGGAAQSVLGLAHWMSARVPNETVVVSRHLGDSYRHSFDKTVQYIPNGVDQPAPVSPSALAEFGLEPQKYLLFVGRMVPEKAPTALLEAYRGLDTQLKLVLVGDSSFTDAYAEEVRRLAAADPRVICLGFVHGERLRALYQYARLFVLPSLLEGLPLTLLEAISHALPVVASDIPPHREVLGNPDSAHALFRTGDVESLRETLAQTLGADLPQAAELRAFRDSILHHYDWDRATDALEQVYLRVAPSPKQEM
ncbi:MAG: glycosyltransferase family 4 protein [Nocardioidaceae bacterium]